MRPWLVVTALFGLHASNAHAAEGPSQDQDPWRDRFSVMSGLGQWILFGGANVAVQYKTRRLALEYSHGQGLNFNRVPFTLTAEEREVGVEKRVPWTTGFGVGASILPNLHALVEFKAHRVELRGPNRNEHLEYTAFTIGPGAFYDVYVYRGFFLQLQSRWWPNVASTLDKKSSSIHKKDGTVYEPAVHLNGPGGVFFNVAVGWTL